MSVAFAGGRERRSQTVEQVSLRERFGEETHRAVRQRLSAHALVGIARDEDDRNMPAGRDQVALQSKAAHPGHLHVEHRGTSRAVRHGLLPRGLDTLPWWVGICCGGNNLGGFKVVTRRRPWYAVGD